MTRLALLSDIHANLPALEAVAGDITGASPDAVYVLGDMINGCAWPVETLDFITARGWPMLIGNHDDAVIQLGTPRMEPRYADRVYYANLWWTRARLRPDHVLRIESLPREISLAFDRVPSVRLLHGLPGNFFAGFRPDSPARWVAEQLALILEPTVADGHTHFPMVRSVGRWQVVNTGSAGAPYDGDPRPSYALMDGAANGWRVTIRRVEYDRTPVEAAYRASGLARDGGVLSVMFHRTVMSGLPWVSDFNWWIRQQGPEAQADPEAALAVYDREYGPGRWAFPLPV
jgi:predicted phosphodiesterase